MQRKFSPKFRPIRVKDESAESLETIKTSIGGHRYCCQLIEYQLGVKDGLMSSSQLRRLAHGASTLSRMAALEYVLSGALHIAFEQLKTRCERNLAAELMAQLALIGMPVEQQIFLHSRALQKIVDPCLLYTSPSPRDLSTSRMPSSA